LKLAAEHGYATMHVSEFIFICGIINSDWFAPGRDAK